MSKYNQQASRNQFDPFAYLSKAFADDLASALGHKSHGHKHGHKSPLPTPDYGDHSDGNDYHDDGGYGGNDDYGSQSGLAALQTIESRELDGTGNNLTHDEWGSIDTPLVRVTPNSYEDGQGAIDNTLPAPRDITNSVMAQPQDTLGNDVDIPNSSGTNEYMDFFGQFVTHDIVESATSGTELLFLDGLPFPFVRTAFVTGSDGVRQPINEETSFLDLSDVYGTSGEALSLLRANNPDGSDSPYLLMGDDDLLPSYNQVSTDSGVLVGTPGDGTGSVMDTLIPATFPGPPTADQFAAGDNRDNQQVPLLSQQTTWAREHNYQVDQLKTMFPDWSDDQLFEAAKAIVEAEYQHIVYTEYLPALIGEGALDAYSGYDSTVDPSIINEFTTAAFRFGHDQSSNLLQLLVENGDSGSSGAQTLAQSFLDIGTITSSEALDEWIRGQLSQYSQEIDGLVTDGNRNLLFGGLGSTVDLEVFDIERGRDHGINGYNDLRVALGLDAYTSFDDFGTANNVDSTTLDNLKTLYGDDINKLDTIVGGLLEEHAPGSQLGETFQILTVMQFEALRDGDRFYYENRFADNPEILSMIESTSLEDIIARTSPGIEHLYHDAFAAHNRVGGTDLADVITGDASDATSVVDLLMGYDGKDTLYGLTGDDDLYGGDDRDKLVGGVGADLLNGEGGNDKLWGGADADTFVFASGTGKDMVKDFNVYEDKIDLTDYDLTSFAEVKSAMHKSHGSVMIDLGDGDSVQLVGVKLQQLSADNFILDDDHHESSVA